MFTKRCIGSTVSELGTPIDTTSEPLDWKTECDAETSIADVVSIDHNRIRCRTATAAPPSV